MVKDKIDETKDKLAGKVDKAAEGYGSWVRKNFMYIAIGIAVIVGLALFGIAAGG